MHSTRLAFLALGGVAALAVAACDLDVGDLNNPGLAELQDNPTAVKLGAACTGLLIGNRGNTAAEFGYIDEVGILGREAYNFDSADPRFIGELLQGDLNPGSPFGGNFWAGSYANLRLGAIILRGVDKVTDMTDQDKASMRGFVRTIEALDLLKVIVTHDTNGAVVQFDFDLTQPLPPIADKATTYAAIVKLLDDAVTDLNAGGDAFTFLLSEGFAGFDTPKTFLQFNRAIRARVAAYMGDYPAVLTALAGSFISDPTDMTPDFDLGVYYSYSTKTGDQTNGLINPNIYAHPSLAADVEKNGATPDDRFTRKVGMAKKAGSEMGKSSTFSFKLYTSPSSPVPLIRNEELILLKAEALFFTGKFTEATNELNIVRTKSGLLPALPVTMNQTVFVNELLYERRYSLLFEGHRWIDLRRFNVPIPLDPTPPGGMPDVANIRFPIPLAECNARPGEAACTKGST